MEYKKKRNPVCKIMKSFFDEFIKAKINLKKNKYIEKEILAYNLYGIQTPLIEYIHKIDEFSTMSDLLLFFSKISLPQILVKKQCRKLKINEYVKIKTNDDTILSGKLLRKNSETICILVDRMGNQSLYEYNRSFLNLERVPDEKIERQRERGFEIRHIKKIYE
jgi:hypothetical protein